MSTSNQHLARYVTTLGQHLLQHFGERVHKVSIDAGFTCPNRDGTLGVGGCSFCNNDSFVPEHGVNPAVGAQVDTGLAAVLKVTRARKVLAYFQAYTNTYAETEVLRRLYEEALQQPAVVGISVGTRPDCVPDRVLDLLQEIQDKGYLVWLELGLQSAFDGTLAAINRGHGWASYEDAVQRAHQRGLDVCAHLIVGLPGEGPDHALISLKRVLDLGVEGLKIHPLHIVKNTRLAFEWKKGLYQPWTQEAYMDCAIDMIRRTPPEVVFHRVTGTASRDILLAPDWCAHKWPVMNGITARMAEQGWHQGDRADATDWPVEPEGSRVQAVRWVV